MPHRAKFCNTMDALCPNLLHSQRCSSDTDVFLDGQTGIEQIGRLRHDGIRRPNRIHIAAVVRRIGNEVHSFTAEEPGCPRHMEGAGHDDGLLPALLTTNFFRESGVLCRISTFIVHKNPWFGNAERQEHPLFNLRFIGLAFKDRSTG